ncbi:MAG: TRL-like family protein [bacterium]|nr:TRL-like family protein [bacterium]
MKTNKVLTRWLVVVVCAAWGWFGAGCAGRALFRAPVRVPGGALVVATKAPLTVNFNGNPCGEATRMATFKRTMYIWDCLITGLEFAWDDAALAKMAREADIERVSYADYELLNVLGVFAQFTVHVYGE